MHSPTERRALADTPGKRAAALRPRALLPDDHYAAVVEFSHDAILTKDVRGIITSWNPGAVRIYGYTEEEAVGRPVSILIPKHRAGEERRILDRVLAGEHMDHYETERVTKDGRLLVVSLSASPIRDESGTVVGASVIGRDITDIHRSRRLAIRLQALTSALSKEISPRGASDVLLAEAVAGLGADAGTVGLLNRSRTEIELAGSVGYSEEGLSGWERFPLDAELPMSRAIRSGEPVWTTSAAELQAPSRPARVAREIPPRWP